MTFPSGGPGYPQQGGGQQPPHTPPHSGAFPPQAPPQAPPPAAPGAAIPQNLPMLLSLAVTVLGVVQYFIGFSDEASVVGQETLFLLVGGLLAALYVLPKGPKALPFAALFSLLGAFETLDEIIGVREGVSVPGIVTVIFILGILQMLLAVGALLLAHDVIKPPAPKPAAPQSQYGPQFGQPGQQGTSQFGQPAPQQQYGQQQPGQQAPQGPVAAAGEPSAPFSQPTTFSPPAMPPTQQATTYAPQQGQFFQQPSSGEQGQQNPGTPPGGFGKQS
ncbi:DUF5336 domain-containing protein [Amycolatopsis sp. NPDC058986]|uniref:DUF5336 domain-containing protein n=1 Tax=unclassified Amycolatopsis TaxID=2618356 RepID=UPI00366AFAB4